MTSAQTKLRRYHRIKRRRGRRWEHFTRLYWRYHFQVHGPHINLWSIE